MASEEASSQVAFKEPMFQCPALSLWSCVSVASLGRPLGLWGPESQIPALQVVFGARR